MATTDHQRCDILVIGGGIVGICAAIAAAEEGASVIVVDAGLPAGSDANAGSLHVQMQSRLLRLFPELAVNVEASLPLYLEAVALWRRMDKEYDGFELVQNGGLMVAETPDQMRFLESKARREAQLGLTVDVVGRADLDRIAGYFGPNIVGAQICREEGKLNPLIANRKLRARALDLGTQLVAAKVTSIGVRQDRVIVVAECSYSADQVIIAAAWGSGDLCRMVGTVLPTKSEPLHMNITEPAAYSLEHLIQHAERPITLKQFQSGQIVIGGGWPAYYEPENQVPRVLEESLIGNVALAGNLVPAIRSLRVLRNWAGLNTTTDGKSVIGRLADTERVVAAVPGDAGYTLGPLIGQAAAALALGRKPQIDVAPFSPARFS